ncbi:hypothetical protein [Muricoccus nepalensis]|uniref:hypothetical protein n=1 Tax=Muricoccus nepalensis TaxID=1854500 RepID=UPI001386D3EB|nr:hypothetical protein [Roseomonas nepalensis]
MADLPKIDIEGSTEPAVALALLRIIMDATRDKETHDRDWILSTYADCLAVVGGAEIDYGEDDEEKIEDA